jgi:hypothetical protein
VTRIACGLICSTRERSAAEAGPPRSNLANAARSGNVNSSGACNGLTRRDISENAWYNNSSQRIDIGRVGHVRQPRLRNLSVNHEVGEGSGQTASDRSGDGVVLSTVRAAADLDYRVIVLSDCVTDPDPEVNRILLAKMFPRQLM